MEQFQQQMQRRKKQMSLILKGSVVVLAALIVLTGIVAAVTKIAGGSSNAGTGSDSGSGGSSGGGTSKVLAIIGPEGDFAVAYIGETVTYKSLVTVNGKQPTLTVDNSKVNLDVAGSYPVVYTATDSTGKSVQYTLTLLVKSKEYTKEALMTLIEAKATALGMSKSMSKTELVQKIYEFVNDPSASGSNANIYFSDVSNTPTQKTLRTTWQADWIEEAIRTLSMNRMSGDCYTYYSVSKAFFEYFGIENYGIQRSASSTEAGTHFWSIVNVGTVSSPRWYYYDATRLAGNFSDGTNNGCLMTEAKLNSYKTSKGGTEFYKFDKWENFPTVSTQTLS